MDFHERWYEQEMGYLELLGFWTLSIIQNSKYKI
jgi:hypothetical protein